MIMLDGKAYKKSFDTLTQSEGPSSFLSRGYTVEKEDGTKEFVPINTALVVEVIGLIKFFVGVFKKKVPLNACIRVGDRKFCLSSRWDVEEGEDGTEQPFLEMGYAADDGWWLGPVKGYSEKKCRQELKAIMQQRGFLNDV